MDKYVIIVAGGKGVRLGNEIPKQFLPIQGKPVLMHTIERFYKYENCINIIVALPKIHIDYWNLLCSEYVFQINHIIVEGGEERFFSVKNALEKVPEKALVAVHDAVRPFVSLDTIKQAYSLVVEKSAVAPAIKPNESIRFIENNHYCAYPRENVYLVQTPQCFYSDILKKAYTVNYESSFTDDLSVVEKALNLDIFLFEGNKENIKITTPFDLIFAESLLNL